MCPKPEGWTDEEWRIYKDRRGGRMVIMSENMTALMATGMTQDEAWNATEDAIMDGTLNLQEGLEEATERWLAARKTRYGY